MTGYDFFIFLIYKALVLPRLSLRYYGFCCVTTVLSQLLGVQAAPDVEEGAVEGAGQAREAEHRGKEGPEVLAEGAVLAQGRDVVPGGLARVHGLVVQVGGQGVDRAQVGLVVRRLEPDVAEPAHGREHAGRVALHVHPLVVLVPVVQEHPAKPNQDAQLPDQVEPVLQLEHGVQPAGPEPALVVQVHPVHGRGHPGQNQEDKPHNVPPLGVGVAAAHPALLGVQPNVGGPHRP